MSNDAIFSIKYDDGRAYIPSHEEAGYEAANPKVAQGRTNLNLPKNPVVERGQDPELFWLDKYGDNDADDRLTTDIRSLYRHEHIAPEKLIEGLYRVVETPDNAPQQEFFSMNRLFGNILERDELDKVSAYYSHHDWQNRLIQGDSLLVMASLLEREGMAGQAQTIYLDPPYGIKYNSNWQMRLNDRNVKDGQEESLSGEPEVVKAFRDTWELGIHSYLSYLRDRLLVARELLSESGSCFVQISDENVHLVRCIMDEVFGSGNFVALIPFRKKTMPLGTKFIEQMGDFLIFYAKNTEKLKYNQLFVNSDVEGDSHWNFAEFKDGTRRKLRTEEINNHKLIEGDFDLYQLVSMSPIGYSEHRVFPIIIDGKEYWPPKGKSWKTDERGAERLVHLNRLVPYQEGNTLRYVLKHSDYPVSPLTTYWFDTSAPSGLNYVVETNLKVIQRCLLMTTDPGDLVIDPTCGSGTTAYVAEQWGRRWITIDTSRIALNIAKQRLMTATFPYYVLHDPQNVRQGFHYKTVPHVTLKSLANDETPDTAMLFDQPREDKKKLRVAGPFTVETLQQFEPVSPESLDTAQPQTAGAFEARVFAHLQSAGVKNGVKGEQAVFLRVEPLADAYLCAEGFYRGASGEKKAYFHIGPQFGTVSKQAVNEAIKACRARGDADWLIILGFSFESGIVTESVTTSLGAFEVTKARMHDDLLQDGLLKRDKKAASFVTIGEPDVSLTVNPTPGPSPTGSPLLGEAGGGCQAVVVIAGMDMYDPIHDVLKSRSLNEIAYWMADTNYDGSNFVARQAFFCGGKKDEFASWRKGLESLAQQKAKRNVERALKIEIDDEAFARLYGFESHPFSVKPGQQIAVRVVSQFGEECTKILTVD